MNKLTITFVLPARGAVPSGGSKVVYEYANALVKRGHRVTVLHPAVLETGTRGAGIGRTFLRYARGAMLKSYRPDTWFRIDQRVRMLWIPNLNQWFVPNADVIVATWWYTAERVAKYPASKGRKFYLLQHLETWSGQEERVIATWRMPLNKIVIARWLQQLAESIGERCTYIPNGLDFEAFGMDVDPVSRDPNRVMMLHHELDWKGSADGLAALCLAHEQIPTLEVDLFGVHSIPDDLPPWFRYHYNPSQQSLRQLYNQAAVFIAPSWTEGWGLPPSEAMMCGTALVATDINGHREFSIHGENALLSPPRQPAALAANIIRVVRDQQLRIQLARAGHRHIQRFTWNTAVDAFEAVLLSAGKAT